jgi:hypothetical protein
VSGHLRRFAATGTQIVPPRFRFVADCVAHVAAGARITDAGIRDERQQGVLGYWAAHGIEYHSTRPSFFGITCGSETTLTLDVMNVYKMEAWR